MWKRKNKTRSYYRPTLSDSGVCKRWKAKNPHILVGEGGDMYHFSPQFKNGVWERWHLIESKTNYRN